MNRPTETLNSNLSDAAICRRHGWGPGTILAGEECGQTTAIIITAVGEHAILARVAGEDMESTWTLHARQWRWLAGPRIASPQQLAPIT